jgi:hypothetical protein
VPMTLSHPAAVLPLRRLGLPMSVMVVASMVPDVPLFLRSTDGYEATHRVVGVPTIDVALTALVVAAWFLLVRDALVDLAPDALRRRLPPRSRLDRRQILLAPAAAVVGAGTHVAWDSFTHPGRWGVRHVTWLQAEHAGLAGSTWAQYVSGVVGLAIVVLTAIAYLRAAPPTDPARPGRRLPAASLPLVVGAAGAAGLVAAARHASSGLVTMAFDGVIVGGIALVVGLVALGVAWNARRA